MKVIIPQIINDECIDVNSIDPSKHILVGLKNNVVKCFITYRDDGDPTYYLYETMHDDQYAASDYNLVKLLKYKLEIDPNIEFHAWECS